MLFLITSSICISAFTLILTRKNSMKISGCGSAFWNNILPVNITIDGKSVLKQPGSYSTTSKKFVDENGGKEYWKKYNKPFSNKGIATGCFKCDGVNKGNIGWPNVDRNTKDGKIALDCLSTACGKQIKHIPKGWCTDPDWKCDCESLN